MIQAESGFNALAESPAGAQGLMQLMPELQAELGVDNPVRRSPEHHGRRPVLEEAADRHKGDIALALASYNAGPTIVGRYKGVRPTKRPATTSRGSNRCSPTRPTTSRTDELHDRHGLVPAD